MSIEKLNSEQMDWGNVKDIALKLNELIENSNFSQTSKSRVVDFNEGNITKNNTGNIMQVVHYTLFPEGTFTKAGQTILADYYGMVTNILGESYIRVSFNSGSDGEDLGGNDVSSTTLPVTGNDPKHFHIRCEITYLGNNTYKFVSDAQFVINGFAEGADTHTSMLVDNSDNGLTQGVGHILRFDTEGSSGTLVASLTNWVIKFIDK